MVTGITVLRKENLFPEKVLEDSRIDKLPPVQIVRNIRGIDFAITKAGDYTAYVKWLQDNTGHKYITDCVREQTEYPEELLCEIIELDNPRWDEGIFETDYYLESGNNEDAELGRRHIHTILEPYFDKGLYIDFLPPIINKFTRARPMAFDFRKGNISILNGINILGKEWITPFIIEYKDFGPNPREYDHDDQVDGGSVGFNNLNSSGNPFTESDKRYYGASKPIVKRTRDIFNRG